MGCEDALAPRVHYEVPFSMYGVLSPDLETQSIRVYVLEDFPTLEVPNPDDLQVTSIDLGTGERVTWRDSTLVDPNGQRELVFRANIPVEFGRRYRIEVLRYSDGARSSAEVRIPDPVEVRIADESNPSAMGVVVEGRNIRALKPEVEYRMSDVLPDCTILRNRFSYEGRERAVEEGWRVDINLVVDRFDILFDCNGITMFVPGPCPPNYIALSSLDLHVLVGDAEWDPPGGFLDPNILSEPTVMSNVENGFGFIGAGYRIVEALDPSRETLESACFRLAGS